MGAQLRALKSFSRSKFPQECFKIPAAAARRLLWALFGLSRMLARSSFRRWVSPAFTASTVDGNRA